MSALESHSSWTESNGGHSSAAEISDGEECNLEYYDALSDSFHSVDSMTDPEVSNVMYYWET